MTGRGRGQEENEGGEGQGTGPTGCGVPLGEPDCVSMLAFLRGSVVVF